MANLTFTRATPLPGPLDHGLQAEGLYTIDSARGQVAFRYRKLLSDPTDPTRLTPSPSAEVYEVTVPLTLADLSAIAGIVFARAATLGLADVALVPSLVEGAPNAVPPPVVVTVADPGPVAPGASVQLLAAVSGVEDQSVRWVVLEGVGTISADGVFTASAEAGTARVMAASLAASSAVATLTVRVG